MSERIDLDAMGKLVERCCRGVGSFEEGRAVMEAWVALVEAVEAALVNEDLRREWSTMPAFAPRNRLARALARFGAHT